MRKTLVLALVLALCSCKSVSKNEYIEGTSITIGLYMPFNGTLYGLQAFNYLSGKRITCTNCLPEVESSHSITNSFFGAQLIDSNRTKISN